MHLCYCNINSSMVPLTVPTFTSGDSAAVGPLGCQQQEFSPSACWDSGGDLRGSCHRGQWIHR